MEDKFRKRADQRNVIAYILLFITAFTLFLGIYLIEDQVQEVAKYMQENPGDKENLIYQVIMRLSFMVIVFFVCQVFLRLYRYNILKADHYLACADSVKLSQDLTPAQKQNFESLLTNLSADKIDLSIPKSPILPILSNKNKAGEK